MVNATVAKRLSVVLALLASVVVLAIPGRALACDTHADCSSWSDNCLVGYGYDTASNYATGIQRILKGLGYYGASVDGL